MKRTLLILILLIILTAFIGRENLIPSSGASPDANQITHSEQPPQPPDPTLTESPNLRQPSPRHRVLENSDTRAVNLTGNNVWHPAIPKKLSGKLDRRFYAINSQKIPDKDQQLDYKKLARVLDKMATESDAAIIVFDLDGQTNIEIPFILYANPERNLTPRARTLYHQEKD